MALDGITVAALTAELNQTILKIILALFKGLHITAVKRTNQKS